MCADHGLDIITQHITEWKRGLLGGPLENATNFPLYVTKAMKQQKEQFQVHMRFQGKEFIGKMEKRYKAKRDLNVLEVSSYLWTNS